MGLRTFETYNFGLCQGGSGGLAYSTAYGHIAGDVIDVYQGLVDNARGLGITNDETKSGIVADISSLPTFEPYFYIRY